jgi:hypothetical protein
MVIKVHSADGTIQTVADGTTIKVNSADGTIQQLTFSSVVQPGATSLLVAANDASALTRSRADYLCDGVADEAQINTALAALPASGGQVVLSEGTFNLAAPLTSLENLGEANRSLRGTGMLTTFVVYNGAAEIDHFISLRGTSFFSICDMTIGGGDLAKYGLYCARQAAETAGKHMFTNVRVVECKVASHLNYASEENTYIKCQFQRSPIGAIFTGYPVYSDDSATVTTPSAWQAAQGYAVGNQVIPVSANEFYYECTVAGTSAGGEPVWPTTPGNTVVDNTATWTARADPRTPTIMPVNFGAVWKSSIAHHLYDCAIGSDHGAAYSSTRCGLMVCGANVLMFGGVLQSEDAAEAYTIIDQTRQQCNFYGVTLDGNSADIGYLIGKYTDDQVDKNAFQNRVNIIGGHLTINAVAATSFITAYNLKASTIKDVTFNGGPAGTEGFDLLDANCKGNMFINCIRNDNTAVPITDAAADPTNIVISRGTITFLAGSGATDPAFSYVASLANRLSLSAGLWINPGASTNPFAHRAFGQAADIFQINDAGVHSWGDGTNPVDTTLSRAAANVLSTADQFRAADGITTLIKAGVIADGDFTVTPPDGTIAVDTANNDLYVRVGGAWLSTALT